MNSIYVCTESNSISCVVKLTFFGWGVCAHLSCNIHIYIYMFVFDTHQFDLTDRGEMSVLQCNQSLSMLVGPGVDVRDSNLGGQYCSPLNMDQFVQYLDKALSKVEAL